MNAIALNRYKFTAQAAHPYGIITHFGNIEYQEAVDNAYVLASIMPFSALYVRRDCRLQDFERVLPDYMLATQLRMMKITTTPLCVFDHNDCIIGILDETGAFYIAANSREVWKNNYWIDLSKADESRLKRAAYYQLRTGLPAPRGVCLPELQPADKELLDKKCADDLPFPLLCRGGTRMPIFNSEPTITVSRHPKSQTNPGIWYDSINMGVLLPMGEVFVEKLNAGTITGFTSRVYESYETNQLEVEIQFVLDGERITHRIRRPAVNFSSATMVCVPFGEYGTIVHSSAEFVLKPSLRCSEFAMNDTDWRVIQIQGGVSYVRILLNGRDQGMVILPTLEKQYESSREVLTAADVGECSYALATKVDNETPRPVVFDSLTDIFPLVTANARNIPAICNGTWFPLKFQGMARSIAQFFRAGDGSLYPDPFPYSVGRSFTDDNKSSITLARTLENGLSSGFKGDMIRSRSDEIKEYAYQGYLAAVLMLGIHQALKYGDQIVLRLAYPNNKQFRRSFERQVNRALELIHSTLVDKHGQGFRFRRVEYRTEAFCCTVFIERQGMNERLGALFQNYGSIDFGGSTTDLAVRTSSGRKFQMVSIPLAGKIVTLSSLIQVARCLESETKSGLDRHLRNLAPELETLLEQQIVTPIAQKLNTAASKTDVLMQMSTDESLLEACQTIIDHFTLKLGPNAQLLRSLICMKDLLLMDMALRQSAAVFTEADLKQSKLHMLRLGNGSKAIDLICDPDNPFQNGRREMDEILAARAVRHMGELASLRVEYNDRPKTEVVNGLCVYTESDEKDISNYTYEDPLTELGELERCLPQAIERAGELARWLRESVPQIVGAIHPYYSGLEGGLDQLLVDFEEHDSTRAVLLNTLAHENGRFSQLHETSLSLGLDIWVMYAILDAVDHQLAIAQVACMAQKEGRR